MDFCFWFPVPTGDEIPKPGATSAWRGASAGEITSLSDGEVIEEVYHVKLPDGYSPAEFKAFAIAMFDARQGAFDTTNLAIGYPGKSYGTYYDGTSWTAG
jgi:hypothetical protein